MVSICDIHWLYPVSCELIASAEKAFTDPEGAYDFVINLAAETKYGQSDEVWLCSMTSFSLL